MKRKVLATAFLVFVMFALFVSGGPAFAGDYTITDLGTLTMGGGGYSDAYGVNNSGQVVGSSEYMAPVSHAFLYSNGQCRT